jgi:hypothetical protein
VFENYVATIETQGTKVEMALWDTAGQEDYAQCATRLSLCSAFHGPYNASGAPCIASARCHTAARTSASSASRWTTVTRLTTSTSRWATSRVFWCPSRLPSGWCVQWVPELKKYLSKVPFVVVGCKTDLRASASNCVTSEEVCVCVFLCVYGRHAIHETTTGTRALLWPRAFAPSAMLNAAPKRR